MQGRTSVISNVSVHALVILCVMLIPAIALGQRHELMNDEDIKSRVEHEITETRCRWHERSRTGQKSYRHADRDHTKPGVENGRAIAEEVARSIRQYVFYSIYDDVNVSVNNGVVTLTGRMTSPHHANELADVASRVPGVREVRNEIKVLPVSIHDDQLRYSIASQIYRDPLFWKYAMQADPPFTSSWNTAVSRSRVAASGGAACM